MSEEQNNRAVDATELNVDEFEGILQNGHDDESDGGGAPEWMATFSDLMTLLMVFFILLFSMSEIQVKKFALAAASLKDGFGSSFITTLEGNGSNTPEVIQVDSTSTMAVTLDALEKMLIEQKLTEIHDTLNQFIQKNGLERNVKVEQAPPGVTLTLQDVVLFRSGEGEISRENMWIIEGLAPVLRAISVPFTIVGHSDNRPIHTATYHSNWELASVRAGGVAREMIEQGIPAEKLHVEAWADQRPESENESSAGRAKNRRVEIFFSYEEVREKVIDESQPKSDS